MAMKTTLNLNDALLRNAKKAAAARGITLTALFEEGLRQVLSGNEPKRPFKLDLPVLKDGWPYPFDVSSRRAMYEWFDENDAR